MKKLNILIACLLLAGLFYTCEQPDKPEFQSLSNVRFSDISMPPDFEIGFAADALFHNPNAIGLTLNSMDLDVFVNDKKSGKLQQDLSRDIDAQSDFTLPLNIRLPLSEKQFIKNLSHMLTGAWKKQSIKIKVKGTVDVGAAGVSLPVAVEHEEEYRIKDYLK